MKNWEDKIFEDNVKTLKDAASKRERWANDAAKYDRFRYGQHFSPAEVRDILAFRQAPLPINITTAIIETAESYILSNNVVINVAPVIFPNDERRNANSRLVSEIYSVLLKESWYQSLANLHYDRAIRDYLNVGRGILCAIPKFQYGEFRVEIAYVPWQNYYPDPAVKSPFYDDADYHCIHYNISEKQAYRLIKGYIPDLTFEQFKEDFVAGSRISFMEKHLSRYEPFNRNYVPLIQTYELSEQNIYKVIANSDEAYGLEYKTYMKDKVPDYVVEMAKAGKIYLIPEKRFYLTEKVSIGSKGFVQVYPIEMYNIVPIVHDHKDNPYPEGKISYIYPLQRALNKFIMIAILNGSLLNVTRVMAEENSIIDENEWIRNASVPNVILKYRMPTSSSKPPALIEAKPLSDGWLHMPQFLLSMMEYVSGIFATMMGNPEKSPDVFSTFASLQTTAGQRLKRRMNNIYSHLSLLGKVVANFYKEYAPPSGYLSYVDEEGKTKIIEYNKLAIENGEIKIEESSDLSIGFKDVRFIVDTSSGYEAATEAAMLTTLATQLQVPQLVPLILKRVNIPDVQKVVDQIDMLANAQMTIQEQQKTIKDLESRIKIMANQIEQNLYKISKTKFDAAFAKMLAELKAQYGVDLEKYKNFMKDQIKSQITEEL